MSRSLRRWIARLMIGFMLFGQFAISAHACGTGAGASAAVAEAPLHDGMPCPEAVPEPQADDSSSALCVDHCQSDTRSADHAPVPSVLPALLSALYSLPSLHDGPRRDAGAAPPPPEAAPPLAILLCCRRD